MRNFLCKNLNFFKFYKEDLSSANFKAFITHNYFTILHPLKITDLEIRSDDIVHLPLKTLTF